MTTEVRLEPGQCEVLIARTPLPGARVEFVSRVFEAPAEVRIGGAVVLVQPGDRKYIGPVPRATAVEVAERVGCKTCDGRRGRYDEPVGSGDYCWTPCPDCGQYAGVKRV